MKQWILDNIVPMVAAVAAIWAAYGTHRMMAIAKGRKPPTVTAYVSEVTGQPGWLAVTAIITNNEIVPLVVERITFRDCRVRMVLTRDEALDDPSHFDPKLKMPLPVSAKAVRCVEFGREIDASNAPAVQHLHGGNGSRSTFIMYVHFSPCWFHRAFSAFSSARQSRASMQSSLSWADMNMRAQAVMYQIRLPPTISSRKP